MSESEERRVREQSVDPDRLLPDEATHAQHPLPDDVEHYTKVYRELLRTKQQMLETLRSAMEGKSETAQAELERADVRMLEMQMDRFRRRLAFWESRLSSGADE